MPKTRHIPSINTTVSMPLNVYQKFTTHVESGKRSGIIVDLIINWLEQEGIAIE